MWGGRTQETAFQLFRRKAEVARGSLFFLSASSSSMAAALFFAEASEEPSVVPPCSSSSVTGEGSRDSAIVELLRPRSLPWGTLMGLEVVFEEVVVWFEVGSEDKEELVAVTTTEPLGAARSSSSSASLCENSRSVSRRLPWRCLDDEDAALVAAAAAAATSASSPQSCSRKPELGAASGLARLTAATAPSAVAPARDTSQAAARAAERDTPPTQWMRTPPEVEGEGEGEGESERSKSKSRSSSSVAASASSFSSCCLRLLLMLLPFPFEKRSPASIKARADSRCGPRSWEASS